MILPTQSLFITGTDTGVGKTHVTCGLLRALAGQGLRVAGMKPVAAGALQTSHGPRNDDALALQAASSVRLPYAHINPVCLARPTSPHLAAQAEGVRIDVNALVGAYERLSGLVDLVLVEGAGGWLVPIGDPAQQGHRGPTLEDLARALGLPVLLVVGVRLGSLNHALLSASAIRDSGLELAGWVANLIDPAFDDALSYVDSLARRLPAPLWGTLPHEPDPRR